MIKFENTEVSGWKAAIRGMRNPMNSWSKSDSYLISNTNPQIGKDDLELMTRLSRNGAVHSKYLRMINVTVDITAPLYWWKEFDTYKVGTVANSCSTMHKIHAKEFELDDFSHDQLNDIAIDFLKDTIRILNAARENYLDTNFKHWWWQMIQLLPSSYNQRRTIQMNYAVLQNIYPNRKNHKLDEWKMFCDWIKLLPQSQLITLEDIDE